MKLLLDQNLSHKLINRLRDVFEVSHTSRHNLSTYGDGLVWSFAAQNGFTIVSKDQDFVAQAIRFGHPPKLIWIRIGNCTPSDVEACLRSHYRLISEFHSSEKGILEIRSINVDSEGF